MDRFIRRSIFRHRAISLKLFLASLPLNAYLGASLWIFYLIFTFTIGLQIVGRGHRESVYVQTSKDTGTAMAFAPRISIPLDEVIEYYGDPDDVVFTSDSSTVGRTTGMLLYWDSLHMVVELPQVADKTYPVHRKTGIKMIIFFNDQDVIAVVGQPIPEEKTVWNGYGNDQP